MHSSALMQSIKSFAVKKTSLIWLHLKRLWSIVTALILRPVVQPKCATGVVIVSPIVGSLYEVKSLVIGGHALCGENGINIMSTIELPIGAHKLSMQCLPGYYTSGMCINDIWHSTFYADGAQVGEVYLHINRGMNEIRFSLMHD